MPSKFPDENDVFDVPSSPETTPLGSAGTSKRNLVELVRDLGSAMEKVQEHLALLDHDHSGEGERATQKLKQLVTHEDVDTDLSPQSIHHTLGTGPNQAAPGNHVHDYSSGEIFNQPYQICTSNTRPEPFLGLRIYETDTNCDRIWSKLPGQNAPRWNLLSSARVPIVRLAAGIKQRIRGGSSSTILEWHTEIEDSFNYFNAGTSLSEVVIKEPGLYDLSTYICFGDFEFQDMAMLGFLRNGAPVPNPTRTWGVAPRPVQGFQQVTEARFNAGDRLSVECRPNGPYNRTTFIGSHQEPWLTVKYRCA